MDDKVVEVTRGYGFDNAAMAFIKAKVDTDNEHDKASVLAFKVFSLYVYLEAQFNNGIRHLIRMNSKLFKPGVLVLVNEQIKFNRSPLEILKLVDALCETQINPHASSRFGEFLKVHCEYRNLVAHGLYHSERGLVEFQEEAAPITVFESEGMVKKLHQYFRKSDIRLHDEKAGESYITNIGSSEIFEHFRKRITEFIEFLISDCDFQGIAKSILWTFDFEFFGIVNPLISVK